MNISKKLIYLCATVLTAVLSVGCSQSEDKDDPDAPGFEEGIPTEVRITLSSRSGNQTRGFGEAKDPTSSVELIHDWWLAFISTKTGSVKVITRNDVTDKTTSTPSTVTDPKNGFEAETFKIILPTGTYRIYAFANIPPKSLGFFNDTNLKIEDEKYKLKNFHLDDFITTSFIGGMRWPDDENIPMTAVIERQIKNTIEEAFNIEVVRAVAKVEFAFSNPSADEITLKNLELSPISNDPSDISIVPNYSAVGIKANEKLITDGVKTGTLSFTLDSKLTTDNRNHTFAFYCNESLPHDEYTQEYKDKIKPLTDLYPRPFTIDLTIDRNGTEEQKVLVTKNITYINRNDWIHIPIEFNDWIVIWALHFYPPIGGYPPVFSQSGSGDNITATVTTGGEFELYPVQIKRNSEATNYYNSVDWDKNITVTLLDGSDDLFVQDKGPAVVDNPNKENNGHSLKAFPKIVMGEFAYDKTGTAKVQIKFYLKDNTNVDTEFKCTFTITRKNGNP